MATKKRKKISSGKKRALSPKQKAALKKGQAALKKWRMEQKRKSGKPATRKTVSKPKKTATKTKTKTAVTTYKRKKGGSMAGGGVVKKATRKVQRFARKSNLAEMLQDSGIVIVSGITSGWITSKLPITDGRIRSLIPVGSGLLLAALAPKKNKIAYGVSKGMVILGCLSLFKQLAPGVPMLAGERVIILPPGNNMGKRLRLSSGNRNGNMMGRRVQLSGGQEYKTSASM